MQSVTAGDHFDWIFQNGDQLYSADFPPRRVFSAQTVGGVGPCIFIYFNLLNSSTTAVCYYAMDFAEETLKLEHLAIRFKLEETLHEFKKVFEQCQADLRLMGTPTKPVNISISFNVMFSVS